MIRDPDDEIGKAMAAALSKKVQSREERPARVKPSGEGSSRWTPPRCGRRGCRNAAAITEYEWQCELEYVTPRGEQPRDFYCSQECGRLVRDGIHGSRGRFSTPPEPSISTIAPREGMDDV